VDYDANPDGTSDPIPKTELYGAWMSRPIVVVDRGNRVIVAFNDYPLGQHVAAAWSDARVNWQFIKLASEKVDRWEPAYEVELRQRANKLHMLYQPLMLEPESSLISVLEWDCRRASQ
jgi:hypothetical protein